LYSEWTTDLEIKDSVESNETWPARGGIDFKLQITGWDRFWVITNPLVLDDELKAYSAGYLEGRLTAQQIQDWHQNFVWGIFGNQPPTASLLKCS
jgi:hypothetical protein